MANNKNEAVKEFLIWRNADAKQKTKQTKQKKKTPSRYRIA